MSVPSVREPNLKSRAGSSKRFVVGDFRLPSLPALVLAGLGMFNAGLVTSSRGMDRWIFGGWALEWIDNSFRYAVRYECLFRGCVG